MPDSLEGRVSYITTYPNKRLSLNGTEFPFAFKRYTYGKDGGVTGTVYYDKFGLRYSVYAKGTADGRFQAGDLALIIYGPSEADTNNYMKNGISKR